MKPSAVHLILAIFCFSLLIFPIRGAQQNVQVISSQGAINGGEKLGWLHTDGRYIKNKQGRTLYFVGATHPLMHTPGSGEPYWDARADPIPFATRMKELGVTWVRLCLGARFWYGEAGGFTALGGDPALYRATIDAFVKELTDRGIYCMVGCMGHEYAGELNADNPTNWLNYLSDLANRYINNPGMCGIYVFNEITLSGVTQDRIRNYHYQAAQMLHAINPNLLIVIDANPIGGWGIDSWWITHQLPQVVYSWHQYPWQDYYYAHSQFATEYANGNYATAKQLWEQVLYDRYFKYSQEHNMCLMCEEFGFNDDSTLNPGDKYWNPGWPQIQHDFIGLLNKYGHSWNQYCWWKNTGENYGLAEDSDYYTLSPVGEVWAQYLH